GLSIGQIPHEGQEDPVVRVGREIEGAAICLRLLVARARSDDVFPGLFGQRDLQRLREGGPLLDQLVADESEALVLGEYDLLLVQGAVLEAQDHPALDASIAGDLGDVTLPETLAVQRVDGQKAAGQALDEAYGHRLRSRRRARSEQDA